MKIPQSTIRLLTGRLVKILLNREVSTMKSNTQNAKIEAITEKTLVLGIDVGSEMHYARAFDYRGIEYSKKPFKFSNTEVGFATFKEWILDLKGRYGKDKMVPGMEPTGHYWFNLGKFLQDNEMKPVLVNPHHVKKSKELDDNNPTKNDRKDPKVIAGLVREGRYMIPYLPDGVYADLRTASNIRFQLQAELTRIQNRISRWFHIYFPEYKTVYGKPDAKSGILILKAAPLPEDILTLGIDGVNQIWRDAKLRAVGKLKALRKEKALLFINITTVVLSGILTIITTKVLKNLDASVLIICILIFVRSTLSELYLSKLLDIDVKQDVIREVILSTIFIGVNIVLGAGISWALYLGVFVIIAGSKLVKCKRAGVNK